MTSLLDNFVQNIMAWLAHSRMFPAFKKMAKLDRSYEEGCK